MVTQEPTWVKLDLAPPTISLLDVPQCPNREHATTDAAILHWHIVASRRQLKGVSKPTLVEPNLFSDVLREIDVVVLVKPASQLAS